MTLSSKIIIAAAVAAFQFAAGLSTLEAEEVRLEARTMKPISGKGAEREGQPHLFSAEIGAKHAVSYFANDNGQCRLTLMVADAFNGEDVPNLSAVRFEAAIDPSRSVRFDTATGKTLEFTCEADAQAMTIKPLNQVALYAPAA
jgi:hypothetical protein